MSHYHEILHAWTWPQYVPAWKISLACDKPIYSKFNFEFVWKILHFSSISFFDKDRVHIDTGFENLFSMSKFIEMGIFLKVQWLWKSKLLLNMKLGVQNFAFFNISRHLVLLWPSALGQWPQILHTSYQAPGASFCKIFIHKSKAIEVF